MGIVIDTKETHRKTTLEIIRLLIEAEREHNSLIWMIPSENRLSLLSRIALSSAASNRYLFKFSINDEIFHLGTEKFHSAYEYCIESLKDIFKAKYIHIGPLSGMHAMSMVITSFSEPNDLIYYLDKKYGGHTHTDSIVHILGRRQAYIPYQIENGWYDVNYQRLHEDLKSKPGRLLYLDPMTYQYEFDLNRLRAVTPKSTFLYYDSSHVMGLIAGGVYPNPLECGFDGFGGSLHKTFPGVQKGFFATNSKEHYEAFQKRGAQLASSYHLGSILGLAVTLAETRNYFESYATQIRKNAHALHRALTANRVPMHGRERDLPHAHVIFIQSSNIHEAITNSLKLYEAGIVTHPIIMPAITTNAGIRIAVQECTVLGMKEMEMCEIGKVVGEILVKGKEPSVFKSIVKSLTDKFKHPEFALQDKNLSKAFITSILG